MAEAGSCKAGAAHHFISSARVPGRLHHYDQEPVCSLVCGHTFRSSCYYLVCSIACPAQEDAFVEVQQADFLQAAAALQPSLSRQEIARYTALREMYQKR